MVFKEYQRVIDDQLQKGIIEKVDDIPTENRVHYIPHHTVITPGCTTKVRVVYDASAKTNQGNKSLNDCLHRGPVMLDDIVSILLRFRLNKVAIASDIEKAFLQVGLQEAERDVTRFLWLRNPENLTTKNNVQIFRFTRVPFGVTSSPFLLAGTIEHHLLKDGSKFAMKILQDIYVDNILTGVDTEEEGIEFFHTTKCMFGTTSMNAREWMTNSKEVLNEIPPNDRATGKFKILGIPWNPEEDAFSLICPNSFEFEKGITKRTILQYLASFYDPMGLLCPSTIKAKIFLQQLWVNKFDWDATLPSELTEQWTNIAHELAMLTEFKIPRYLGKGESYELHCFCDASQSAYGTGIYLRVINRTGIKSHLIFAKARLAPLHNAMTIPRLELMAVHIGSKCLKFISSALPFAIERQFIWTDSQCVLHWIKSEKPLTPFVRNLFAN